MQRAPEASEWVALGVLGRGRGLRGDLWFRSYNAATEALGPGVAVRLALRDGSKRTATIESVSDQGGGLVIHLAGVDTREASDPLVGASLELQRKDFPPLAEGEYYHCDVPGMKVVDPDGRALGTVVRVEAYPTVDALVIATDKGEVEVPITEDLVRSLDVPSRLVVLEASALED